MSSLTDKLLVIDGEDLGRVLKPLVAEATAAVIEKHDAEVRRLRRDLFVLKGVLTAEEAGHVLGGVCGETVMAYVREKGLVCYRPGKAPLFMLAGLQEWVMRFPDTTRFPEAG